MADYVITSSNVQYSGTTVNGIAGEAIAAGDVVYKKAADQKIYKADANAAGAAPALGIAVNSAAVGQPVSYTAGGEVTLGAGVFTAAGQLVALSANAGKLCPVADLASGHRVQLLGWSTDTDKMKVNPVDTGVTLA
ncbi:MAG: hypothetical protein AB1716_00995 [Planctomycetota bacterium]